MKKISMICTLALLVMASCSREQAMNDKIDPTSGEEAQGGVIFTATLEGTGSASDGDDEDGTRTSISGTKVLWNQGDAVKIFWNGGSVTATALQSGSTTDFSAAVDLTASAWYAVYPASLTASYSDASGLSVTVPAEQDGSFENANIMVSTTTGTEFPFKNLCGLMKFSIANTAVRKIIIRSINNDVDLAGTLPITFSSGVPEPGAATSTSKAITLLVSGAGTYYAAFLPGATMTKFYIELQDGEGNLIPGVIGSTALTMTRSQVQNLGALDTQMRLDWFVTPDGGGSHNGSSWENALSWTEFMGWVNTSTAAYPLPAKIARISGSTFNFKEGTYTATEQIWLSFSANGKVVPFSLVGGYASSSTGTSKASRTPRNTIFTSTSSTDRLFKVIDWISVSVDGIKFQGMTCTDGSYGGGVFYLAGTASRPSSISCTDCWFYGNEAPYNSGGALYISNGDITLNNCLFENNQASADSDVNLYAGAVFVREYSKVDIRNCRFIGNYTKAMGGAMYLEGLSKDAYLSGCYFSKNYTYGTANIEWRYCGGALAVSAPSPDNGKSITLDGCQFVENYTKGYGGAVGTIFLGTNKMFVKNCQFTDNHSHFRGGAWAGGSRDWNDTDGSTRVRACFESCTFTGNYAENEKGACTGHAMSFNQGWLAMNNCAFWNNGTNASACTTNSTIIDFECNKDRFTGGKSVLLMTNTTIVAHSNVKAAIYIYMSDAYVNLANCLIVSPKNTVLLGTTGDSRGATFRTPTSGAYNVISDNGSSGFYTTYSSHTQAVALGDYATWTAKFTDGYKFNGNGLNLDAYVTSATTLSNFGDALTSSVVTYNLGSEFKTFIGDNFGKDISGATRTGNFTPGCWQLK